MITNNKYIFIQYVLLYKGVRCPFFERSVDQISIEYRITEEGTMSALIRCANNIYLFMECGVDDMWQSNGSCSSNSPTFGMLDQLSLLLKNWTF